MYNSRWINVSKNKIISGQLELFPTNEELKATFEHFGKSYWCIKDDEGNEVFYGTDRFI